VSELQKQTRSRLNHMFVIYVLAAAAILLAFYAVFQARHNDLDRHPQPVTVGEPVTPDTAQAILDRANETTEFAGLLLSFVEAASAIVGVLLAVGAYILRRSILEEFERAIEKVDEMERRTKERESELAVREKELAELRDRLTRDVAQLVEHNRAEIEDIRKYGRDSMRVVSLQLVAEQQVRAHNLATALKTLTAAHELEPTNQATNYLLGYLYTARKEFDKAIEYLQSALKPEATFTPALAALGLALRRKGDAITDPDRMEERDRLWAQAEICLLDALKPDPSLTDMDGESYYGTLGGLYRRQGRYQEALRAYDKARKCTPASSYPIINLAALHTRLGNLEEARHYFERVLENALLELDDDPRNMWTRMDYAQALLVLGRRDEALAQLRIVLDQGPERSLLETVHNGLCFLAESNTVIDGLADMIAEMEVALAAHQDASTSDNTGAHIAAGTSE